MLSMFEFIYIIYLVCVGCGGEREKKQWLIASDSAALIYLPLGSEQ